MDLDQSEAGDKRADRWVVHRCIHCGRTDFAAGFLCWTCGSREKEAIPVVPEAERDWLLDRIDGESLLDYEHKFGGES